MSEAARSWMMTTPDGRRWRVEDFSGNPRLKVTNIDSPTGYYEWISPDQLDPKWERPNLYAGVKGLFTETVS
jgi:hypothetical protein